VESKDQKVQNNQIFIVVCYYYCIEVHEFEQSACRMWTVVLASLLGDERRPIVLLIILLLQYFIFNRERNSVTLNVC